MSLTCIISNSPILFHIKIVWANRLKNGGANCTRTITVDGTDFRFQPQNDGRPFKAWYSHKFKSSAVRYEIGISIQSGDIVWISSPWPAGSYPDIKIFRNSGLRDKLLQAGERAEADGGYKGEPTTIELPDNGHIANRPHKAKARMRHETCNKRFKQWSCLNERFRHFTS